MVEESEELGAERPKGGDVERMAEPPMLAPSTFRYHPPTPTSSPPFSVSASLGRPAKVRDLSRALPRSMGCLLGSRLVGGPIRGHYLHVGTCEPPFL